MGGARVGVAAQYNTDQLSLTASSPAEDLFPGRRYDGGLDSGFHSVDSGSKRWSGNEVSKCLLSKRHWQSLPWGRISELGPFALYF